MELSVEVLKTSKEFYDCECGKCGRRIRFTPAFFMQEFSFPLELKCKKCGKKFHINLKIHETDVTKLGPNNRSRKGAPREVGGDPKSGKSSQ